MRELERDSSADHPACTRLAIVGQGRLGTALTRALRDAGYTVDGPLGRGASGLPRGRGASGRVSEPDADSQTPDAILLCVPDDEIANAATAISPGPLVGHCSGASTLAPLDPHEAFSLHPLMTVTADGAEFRGAGAAVAGSSQRALALAGQLATALGMHAVEVADADRAAYHAAASIASNFLITLEAAAERMGASAGAERALFVPLVRATVENWARLGPERALTGPVARGDEATIQGQRAAIAARAEDLLPLFDALVETTRAIAGRETALT